MNIGQFKTFNITILMKTDKITVFLQSFLAHLYNMFVSPHSKQLHIRRIRMLILISCLTK